MAVDLKTCKAFQSLSVQYKKFVLEYLKDFNASKAAIRAGYAKKSSRSTSSEILTKPNVQKALSEVSEKVMLLGDIADIQEIAEFYTLVMRGNIKNIVSWNEEGLVFTASSKEMDDKTARLIKKIKVTEKTSQKGDWTECKTEVELHDPIEAANSLGRYHGMFKEKVEHSGRVGVEGDEDFLSWLLSRKK